MSKNLSETLQNIMRENASKNVEIFTNHLKIEGTIHEFKGKCEDCHTCLIALKDVMVCRLEDYCKCKQQNCDCDDYICFNYDWLNINVSEIVAFSII